MVKMDNLLPPNLILPDNDNLLGSGPTFPPDVVAAAVVVVIANSGCGSSCSANALPHHHCMESL